MGECSLSLAPAKTHMLPPHAAKNVFETKRYETRERRFDETVSCEFCRCWESVHTLHYKSLSH